MTEPAWPGGAGFEDALIDFRGGCAAQRKAECSPEDVRRAGGRETEFSASDEIETEVVEAEVQRLQYSWRAGA